MNEIISVVQLVLNAIGMVVQLVILLLFMKILLSLLQEARGMLRQLNLPFRVVYQINRPPPDAAEQNVAPVSVKMHASASPESAPAQTATPPPDDSHEEFELGDVRCETCGGVATPVCGEVVDQKTTVTFACRQCGNQFSR